MNYTNYCPDVTHDNYSNKLSVLHTIYSTIAVIVLSGNIMRSDKIKQLGYCTGVCTTLGVNRIPFMRSLWNERLEPFLIHSITSTVTCFTDGFVDGLKIDDVETDCLNIANDYGLDDNGDIDLNVTLKDGE
jgi:hypothetical protein